MFGMDRYVSFRYYTKTEKFQIFIWSTPSYGDEPYFISVLRLNCFQIITGGYETNEKL